MQKCRNALFVYFFSFSILHFFILSLLFISYFSSSFFLSSFSFIFFASISPSFSFFFIPFLLIHVSPSPSVQQWHWQYSRVHFHFPAEDSVQYVLSRILWWKGVKRQGNDWKNLAVDSLVCCIMRHGQNRGHIDRLFVREQSRWKTPYSKSSGSLASIRYHWGNEGLFPLFMFSQSF